MWVGPRPGFDYCGSLKLAYLMDSARRLAEDFGFRAWLARHTDQGIDEPSHLCQPQRFGQSVELDPRNPQVQAMLQGLGFRPRIKRILADIEGRWRGSL